MKASRFNIVVSEEHSDKSILFNSKIGQPVLIETEIEKYATPQSIFDESGLPKPIAQQISQLANAGYFVDENSDELGDLKESYLQHQKDQQIFSLCIAPTYACNLKCPYCYEADAHTSGKIMPMEVQDKIVSLVENAYEHSPFNRMEVQWYGGEPLLAPLVIEHLSDELISFCDKNGIEYDSDIVSNATLIDQEKAAMLKGARISNVVTTIDGPEDSHNYRRPARDGSNSYESVLQGIENLRSQGINVVVLMNTDKVNDSSFDELNQTLKSRFGINAIRTKLNDYYGTFGSGNFCAPDFHLMDHAEFSRIQCKRFCEDSHSPQDFLQLMQPIELFCRGQRERYYAIDANGDVYKCDGHLGRPEHVIFKLQELDEGTNIPENLAPEYPFNAVECINCQILPLCKGNCEWERMQCSDHPCHPLKYTIEDYLLGWHRAQSRMA